MTIKVPVTIELPKLPNFLLIHGSDHTIDVGYISDRELLTMGDAWTKALIEHAAKRRLTAVKP